MGLVLSGEVRISMEDMEGRRNVLSVLTPPDLFGEVFALSGVPSSVTAYTDTGAEVLFLDARKVSAVCRDACGFHRQLIVNLMGILSRKMSDLIRRYSASASARRAKRYRLFLRCTIRAQVKTLLPSLLTGGNGGLSVRGQECLVARSCQMQEEKLITFNKNEFRILGSTDGYRLKSKDTPGLTENELNLREAFPDGNFLQMSELCRQSSFDPDVKLLSCAFCGTKISPDDIVSQDAADGFLQGGAWEDDTVGMICDNCGAEIISEKNTLASFCAFCGAPGIRVSDRGGVRPSRMIPFTYGREEAEKEFLNWCKTKKFLPRGFSSAGTLKKLTGLYVPFWLMDYMVGVNVTWIDHMEEKNEKGQSSTAYYEKRKQGLLVWNKVPVDGASKIDDTLMEGIEPFNYEQLRAYDTKYLAGFFADR
jgi:hypothetical protein